MTGYSSKVATATWVGNVSGTQNVGGISIDGTPGGFLRHEIWRQIMTVANELYPGESFPAPPPMYLGASNVIMPDVNALPPEIALEILRDAGLAAQVSGSQVLSSNPVGTVVINRSISSPRIFSVLSSEPTTPLKSESTSVPSRERGFLGLEDLRDAR
jgi:membrane peptidoglycan carboxypeptidase